LFLIVLLAAGLGAFQIEDETLLLVMAMVFLLPAVIIVGYLGNVIRTGGFCRMYMSSAAQQIQVPGVSTVGKAKKLVRLLDQRISERPLSSVESESFSQDESDPA
jgi:hypothetical protein